MYYNLPNLQVNNCHTGCSTGIQYHRTALQVEIERGWHIFSDQRFQSLIVDNMAGDILFELLRSLRKDWVTQKKARLRVLDGIKLFRKRMRRAYPIMLISSYKQNSVAEFTCKEVPRCRLLPRWPIGSRRMRIHCSTICIVTVKHRCTTSKKSSYLGHKKATRSSFKSLDKIIVRWCGF